MKNWKNAEIEVLDVKSTAFGPLNPDDVDADKYAVKDGNGNIEGWEELYGNYTQSLGNN